MPALDTLAALLVALLWGLHFVTSKVGVAAFPTLLFVALRFAAVAALLLPVAGRPSRRDLRVAVVFSVFFGSLCFALFFSGLRLGTAGLSAALSQLMTPFAILFAVPVLGERPMPHVQVASSWHLAASRSRSPSLFAAPQLALASVVVEHGQLTALRGASALAWASMGYTVLFGAIAAFGLWFWLVGRHPLARLAPFALLQNLSASRQACLSSASRWARRSSGAR